MLLRFFRLLIGYSDHDPHKKAFLGSFPVERPSCAYLEDEMLMNLLEIVDSNRYTA